MFNLMKKIFHYLSILYFGIAWSQNSNIIRVSAPITSSTTQAIVAPIVEVPTANSISFEYDDAGNQLVRKPIYLASPRPGRPTETKSEEPKEFVESDIYSDIKYYPNPTVEILYVKWKNQDEWFVNNIQVFNFSGQLMGTLTIDSNSEQVEVDFRAYPTGMYELVLAYNNGKQKTLKIIKK